VLLFISCEIDEIDQPRATTLSFSKLDAILRVEFRQKYTDNKIAV